MHIFVLGGTGFIGTSVVRALIRRGHRLIGLARSEMSAEKLRGIGSLPQGHPPQAFRHGIAGTTQVRSTRGEHEMRRVHKARLAALNHSGLPYWLSARG